MTGTRDIAIEGRLAELESAVERLAAQNGVLAADNGMLSKSNAELSRTVSALRAELEESRAREASAKAELDKVVAQIMVANARAFGAKSEKIRPWQLSLFNDMEAALAPGAPEPPADEVAKPARRRKRRECVDWSKYDTEVVEHRLDPSAAACPACGAPMEEMGWQVKRVFRIRPAQACVEEHRQYKYVCPACSDANQADGGETPAVIVRAPMPQVTPIEGSCASASLIAYILDRKYCMGLPVYRIEADLRAATGLTVTRQAMAGWVVKGYGRWLALIYGRIRERIASSDILHIDETRLQVLKEPGRRPQSKSWAWVFCTPESADRPAYMFKYSPSRGHEVPASVLPSGWGGTIVTDGYSAYAALQGERPGMRRVSCLVHIKRYFVEVAKGSKGDGPDGRPPTVSEEAIARIAQMFHIDKRFRGMGPEERAKARRRELKPKMDAFMEWLEGVAPGVMPDTPLDKAVTYARNQFPFLYNALDDGRLPLENNRAENAIRPFCVGRRAWLFSDTEAGAEASCGIYSIVTTAKANGLSPMRYLEWVLEEMPNAADVEGPEALEALMPWSPSVPARCRMSAAEAGRPDPMAQPLIDIDPRTLDED